MPLIPQYTQDEFEAAKTIADSACNSAKTFSIVTFLICLCLGYGLKYLWGTINVLQFIIFMIQWLITIPDNAKVFLTALKMLALMEFMDDVTHWIME